jgi:hypothetical protein
MGRLPPVTASLCDWIDFHTCDSGHKTAGKHLRSGKIAGECTVLTPSVLNLLDRQQLQPEVRRAEKGEQTRRFPVDESQSRRQETRTESIGPKAPFPGIKRPLLPDLSLNPFDDPASNPRSFEDFLRALDEVDRASRRPELDVFE